jgi:hypothetical protein
MNTLANIHIESLNNTIDNTIYHHLAYTLGMSIVHKLDYLLWEHGAYSVYEQVSKNGILETDIINILDGHISETHFLKTSL